MGALALCIVASANAAPADLDVRSFGAKGDGKTLDTDAIQNALDDCGRSGGGTVRLTAGTYLSRPLEMHGHTTLFLDRGATLQATDDEADFAGDKANSFIPFIRGKGLTNVAIAGHGVIDGAGAKWWVPAEAARQKQPGYTLPRPNLIVLTGCRRVRLQDVTLQNSPKFHFVPTECEDVVVTNVTILAPPRSPNTDAIDPSNCRRVLITKCRIDVGDDNVAIKAGKKVPGREFACEEITITDCAFLHGHGVSIGSETAGGVRNVLVRNCTFENTENGLRIKSQRGRGGRVENIIYSDIRMTNVIPAVTLTCYYMFSSAGDPVQRVTPETDQKQPITPLTPSYRHIVLKNVSATCQAAAGLILGLPESPIEDVVFDNVQISSVTGLKMRNASKVKFRRSAITPQRGPPVTAENSQFKGLKITNSAAAK
jgi:polygalacturonase